MSSPPQDVYATNLQQNFGYPLRSPEPNSTLQPYDKEGFQIGDVGFVNEYGEFILLFNIGFPLPDDLRESGVPPYEPIKLAKPYRKPTALPEDHLFMTGAKRVVNPSRGGYEFTATSNAGAILILPSGATLFELQNKRELEAFRKVATNYALRWCKFAERDSLYLVTGLYKTRSWTLGSFHKGSLGEKILVDRNVTGGEAYKWMPAFEVDYRPGPQNNSYENQTVLIKGFRMTVSARIIASFLALLFALLQVLFGTPQRWLSRITVEPSPRLSQPLHPSDIINRFLLDKNFGAWVAVTHDNEWIDMVERGRLRQEDLMQEARLRDVLAKEYTCSFFLDAVYLRSQIQDTDAAHYKLESSRPTPVTEGVQNVITHIRAENVTVGLGRIPVGFYVQLQFHAGTSRWTENKPVPVDGCVIQWDDLIHLPSDPSAMVRLAVFASFEFAPMLVIVFPEREGESPCSSLLIAVQQWHCNHRAPPSSQMYGSFDGEESPELVTLTDQGHDALLRYHKHHSKEDLDLSVACFERALHTCPAAHTCRAAALFNLAIALFVTSQAHGTSLDPAISHYREALGLRHSGHPDRPATLLHLSQALLHHYGATGHEASPEGELQKLIDELIKACPEGNHERHAADLTSLTS
ncbi:hypothetical protein J3R83DRAFT_3133 [Lanmaoa asiatica]|nr:hypothetical protein J3R83DRAFT_3133 [Lanmaoa asiatica]